MALPGATVRLYATTDCTGMALASGLAAPGSGRFEFQVAAAKDATTTFHAIASNGLGSISACSSGLDYRNDATPPAAPSWMGSSPPSPSASLTPRVFGTAEPLSVVHVFAAADCVTAQVATAVAAVEGTFDLALPVTPDSGTTFSAKAADASGNVSPCSGPLAYQHDGRPPASPLLAGVVPSAGSNLDGPRLEGSAEAGNSITVFIDDDCTSEVAATATAAPDGSFSAVVPIDANRSTSFWARSTDPAGNVSPCSTSAATFALTRLELDFDAPGCYPTLTRVGGTAVSISRPSDGSVAFGAITDTCASDQLRVGTSGLVVEEGRTNQAAYSERLDDAAWTLSGTSCRVLADHAVAPDGTATMDLLDSTSGQPGDARCQHPTTPHATVFTASTWVAAAGDGAEATVRAHCAPGGIVMACRCERSDGGACVATPSGDACAAWVEVGLSPVRVAASVACTAATTAPAICLEPGPAWSATGAALFWGAQLEAGAAFPTAYISTLGASASRAADAVTITSPEAGLLAAGTAVLTPDGSPRDLGTLLATNDPSVGARLAVESGTLRLTWASQLVEHDIHVAPGHAAKTHIGWSVKAGQACLYWNGIEHCGPVSSAAQPASETYLGAPIGGGTPLLNGALRRLDFGTAPSVAFNSTALLALGDSLTAFNPQFCAKPWPDLVVDALGAPWVASNGGVNALRTPHILARWRTVYATNGHGVVAVMGGTNDVTNGDPPATIFANLKSLYEEARAAGRQVIPMTVPPSNRFAGKLAAWEQVNDLIRGYCVETGLRCADVASVLDSGAGSLAPAFDSGDHLHLNQAGCDAIAEVVLGRLR